VLAVPAFSGPWFIDNIRFLVPPPALSTLDPILSFEDTSKWTCAQVGLTNSTTVKTHLTKSLKVNTAPGAMTIVSAAFATGALNAPTGKFRIDLRKPSQSGTNHGTFSVQFDVPSAGITNVSTASVSMTPLAANAFAQVEVDLPANVKLAVNGEYGDMRVKLIVNAVSGTGPWHFDNIRFV
jgi:hypothetical protein